MIISSCPIIICLRKSRGRLSLHGGRELNYTHALLILDFHLTVKTLNVLLQDGEQSSFFFQVECQGRKRIKLYTTPGRNPSLGQLSGGFTRLMLFYMTTEYMKTLNFFSAIEKHLKPGPWNHPLKQFCDEHLDSLKFFIRKYPKGPKSAFREIDMKASLRQQLANVVILNTLLFICFPSITQQQMVSIPAPRMKRLFENMEFDFDQGLMDAYSDLISGINPDDFLDLESVFSKEEENDHFGSMGIFFSGRGIGRGEIAE
ncbi:hypothetical protein OIU74_001827 [Salix koriyanagi]|uniref:BCD1 alpha/beta domain-containing protein n=1 Tax=Salix koriyanagi TaxID=2511006 RepID=A0A9Q0X4V2_9ROSI|nr:hypothetical protein OIU74_001827 [Salix koriyanagi]